MSSPTFAGGASDALVELIPFAAVGAAVFVVVLVLLVFLP